MARARFTLVFGLLCAACVSAPDLKQAPRIEMRFGEKPKAEPKPAAKPKPPEPVLEEDTPDPPAKSSNKQLIFHLKMDHQVLSVERVERSELKEERVTPRRYGRFSLEAFRGEELVERLRFDFPLLGDTRSALDEVEPGLVTSVQVEFPELEDVTLLRVVDRKSRKKMELSVPAPGEGAASAAGGGASVATGGAASSVAQGTLGPAKPAEKGTAAGPSSSGGAASTQKAAK